MTIKGRVALGSRGLPNYNGPERLYLRRNKRRLPVESATDFSLQQLAAQNTKMLFSPFELHSRCVNRTLGLAGSGLERKQHFEEKNIGRSQWGAPEKGARVPITISGHTLLSDSGVRNDSTDHQSTDACFEMYGTLYPIMFRLTTTRLHNFTSSPATLRKKLLHHRQILTASDETPISRKALGLRAHATLWSYVQSAER